MCLVPLSAALLLCAPWRSGGPLRPPAPAPVPATPPTGLARAPGHTPGLRSRPSPSPGPGPRTRRRRGARRYIPRCCRPRRTARWPQCEQGPGRAGCGRETRPQGPPRSVAGAARCGRGGRSEQSAPSRPRLPRRRAAPTCCPATTSATARAGQWGRCWRGTGPPPRWSDPVWRGRSARRRGEGERGSPCARSPVRLGRAPRTAVSCVGVREHRCTRRRGAAAADAAAAVARDRVRLVSRPVTGGWALDLGCAGPRTPVEPGTGRSAWPLGAEDRLRGGVRRPGR